uniref:EGF-like domain-containing protein n=1 Tax=Chromera velia CCMP2878 TaxID=1169474 RepID=A0A0G4I529_9ALVE|mmetsp:Transcript_8492/g.16568  ORF Transcript_8492/g.16568 Transcript_8492/m.16568 type:complete len:441 (-) Transcript_8492:220-1542(-)|eukprot:Cvel_11070.t1-p1 / transcript=Cvel_11070.t1 / gene=Cvel_11070 / organism=Chromera_velia_CCMP2878 / gene_product=hypothetical protein / transcript_product=hypothetical protein / location=Cvel_scaffold683:42283-43602(+) / protein_length=440 / sequence_SO=supercontig / SO=protein_coding / is_pseudo=false
MRQHTATLFCVVHVLLLTASSSSGTPSLRKLGVTDRLRDRFDDDDDDRRISSSSSSASSSSFRDDDVGGLFDRDRDLDLEFDLLDDIRDRRDRRDDDDDDDSLLQSLRERRDDDDGDESLFDRLGDSDDEDSDEEEGGLLERLRKDRDSDEGMISSLRQRRGDGLGIFDDDDDDEEKEADDVTYTEFVLSEDGEGYVVKGSETAVAGAPEELQTQEMIPGLGYPYEPQQTAPASDPDTASPGFSFDSGWSTGNAPAPTVGLPPTSSPSPSTPPSYPPSTPTTPSYPASTSATPSYPPSTPSATPSGSSSPPPTPTQPSGPPAPVSSRTDWSGWAPIAEFCYERANGDMVCPEGSACETSGTTGMQWCRCPEGTEEITNIYGERECTKWEGWVPSVEFCTPTAECPVPGGYCLYSLAASERMCNCIPGFILKQLAGGFECE